MNIPVVNIGLVTKVWIGSLCLIFSNGIVLLVDTAVNVIDFMTANPGISSSYYWATIQQQNTSVTISAGCN